jgi:hypothetical protein
MIREDTFLDVPGNSLLRTNYGNYNGIYRIRFVYVINCTLQLSFRHRVLGLTMDFFIYQAGVPTFVEQLTNRIILSAR